MTLLKTSTLYYHDVYRYSPSSLANNLDRLLCNALVSRKKRDEMSHNVFLMLQECNKFREHQAREILIELLEKEQESRKQIIEKLRNQVEDADKLLASIDEVPSEN